MKEKYSATFKLQVPQVFCKKRIFKFKYSNEFPNQKVLIRGDIVYNDNFILAVRKLKH